MRLRNWFIFALALLLSATVDAQTEIPDSLAQEAPDQAAAVESPVPVAPVTIPVTPVDVDDSKPRQTLHYYDKHGEPLDEPVLFLATLDTIQKATSKPLYPKFSGVNIGVNFADLVFMAFGQKSGSFDLWANVSIFNWIFPVVECGMGYSNPNIPANRLTQRTKPAFYAKAGINYNFLYKSDPAYQAYLGLRAGVTRFRYDVYNLAEHVEGEDEPRRYSLTGLKSTCWFGEVLAGLQVKIVGCFSLGWTARYHLKFHTGESQGQSPDYIPGYGSSRLSMTISAIFTVK